MVVVLLFLFVIGGANIVLSILFYRASSKAEPNPTPLPTSHEETNEQQFSRINSRIASLEKTFEKLETVFTSMASIQNETTTKISDFNQVLHTQKEFYASITQEHELFKEEKKAFQEMIAQTEKALQNLQLQHATKDSESKKQDEALRDLESKNQMLSIKLKNLESQFLQLVEEEKSHNDHVTENKSEKEQRPDNQLLQIQHLNQTNEQPVSQDDTEEKNHQENIQNTEKETQIAYPVIKEEGQENHADISSKEHNASREEIAFVEGMPKSNIEDILMREKLITENMRQKAKEYQVKFNGDVIQYLITNGHLNEQQFVSWVNQHYKVPYVPLRRYLISEDVINLIPADIAQQYWLIPVEKIENVIIVAMVDPLNTAAIKAVEEISGCTVTVYLSLLSEIVEALREYYKIPIKEPMSKEENPFLIKSNTYKGAERRSSIRLNLKLDINFSDNGHFTKSVTRNISRGGFSFEAEKTVPLNSRVTIQINLPKEYNQQPITTTARVIRVLQLENNKFDISVKILKMSKQEANAIMKYASILIKEKAVYLEPFQDRILLRKNRLLHASTSLSKDR